MNTLRRHVGYVLLVAAVVACVSALGASHVLPWRNQYSTNNVHSEHVSCTLSPGDSATKGRALQPSPAPVSMRNNHNTFIQAVMWLPTAL